MNVCTAGIKIKFTYCSCSTAVLCTTMVRLKTMPDLYLVTHNYTTHCSLITVLICYAL